MPPSAIGGELFTLRHESAGRILVEKGVEGPTRRGFRKRRGGDLLTPTSCGQTSFDPRQPAGNPHHHRHQQKQQPHRRVERNHDCGRNRFRHARKVTHAGRFEKSKDYRKCVGCNDGLQSQRPCSHGALLFMCRPFKAKPACRAESRTSRTQIALYLRLSQGIGR